jgi:rod shape-determining protein MreC
VTKLAAHTAQVTLLTDETSNVAALDLKTHAPGLVSHGSGRSDQLFMGRVQKSLQVSEGDEIVTAGSLQGKLPSMYPRGLKIGKVANVGQNDIDPYKEIQVQPFVDFSSLGSVLVLVSKKPTPQLP